MKKRSTLFCGFSPRLIFALVALIASLGIARAQSEVNLKTNLLYDATATVNLGVEMPIAKKWSLELSGNVNAWKIDDHLWKHWLAQPEARYWFCDRFSGHFLGMHLLGGQYNLGNLKGFPDFLGTEFSELESTRVQGWFAGAGIAYGYTWIMSKHWSMEAEVGIGYAYTRYDRYPCAQCGSKIENDKSHNYFGPTKLALNLIYVF